MSSYNFNTYYENIDYNFWRELCVKEGVLRHYEKNELFAERGQVARYIGYIKSGTLKYVAYVALSAWSLPVNLSLISHSLFTAKNLAFQSSPLLPARFIAYRRGI